GDSAARFSDARAANAGTVSGNADTRVGTAAPAIDARAPALLHVVPVVVETHQPSELGIGNYAHVQKHEIRVNLLDATAGRYLERFGALRTQHGKRGDAANPPHSGTPQCARHRHAL